MTKPFRVSAELAEPIADAPEIKGTTMYFQPDRVVWVAVGYLGGKAEKPRIYYTVALHGPSTRTAKPNQGAAYFNLDTCPEWLPRPTDWLVDAEALIDRHLLAATGGERR